MKEAMVYWTKTVLECMAVWTVLVTVFVLASLAVERIW